MNTKRLIARAVVLFAAAALVLGFTSPRAGAGAASTIVSVAAVGGGGQPATAADGLNDSKIAFTMLCAVSLPPRRLCLERRTPGGRDLDHERERRPT
jgi:hypothetical protein